MKAEYRNSQRSKELIKSALITLIEKKQNVSDITITEIVNLANINRGTFYNHYNNIMEVLDEMKAELISKLSDALKTCSEKNDIETFMSVLLVHFKKNEKTYKKIIKGIPRAVIDDMKIEFLKQISLLKIEIDPVVLNFTVNGLAGLYLDYLEGRINITLEDIAQKGTLLLHKLIETK